MLVFGGESQEGRLKDVWALDTKVSGVSERGSEYIRRAALRETVG